MKKRVIIFIAVIIIAITGALFINKSFIEDSQDYLKGILEASKPQNISIFMLPAVPILTIISPENITYSASTILLNYSARNAETVWYSLDSIENITITSPLYFSAAEGPHILYLYANNSLGESVKSVTFSIQIETIPSGEGGGSGGGAGETEPLKENITSQETSANVTEQEMPENITKKPEEKPASTREITIKFLIILLFLVLLIILVILLIVRIKRKLKKKLSLKKRLWREKRKKKK